MLLLCYDKDHTNNFNINKHEEINEKQQTQQPKPEIWLQFSINNLR